MEIAWYIPVLIFLARLCDVPIGTVRMIFVIQGHRWVSAGLGFFEVIIWALAVGGVIHYLTEPAALVAYGAGFSAGTLLGMHVEERIAVGTRMVRVINPNRNINVARALREHGYKCTRLDGEGQRGPVELVFFAIKRRRLPAAIQLIEELTPQAFVTVERADRAASVTLVPDHRVRRSFGRFLAVRK